MPSLDLSMSLVDTPPPKNLNVNVNDNVNDNQHQHQHQHHRTASPQEHAHDDGNAAGGEGGILVSGHPYSIEFNDYDHEHDHEQQEHENENKKDNENENDPNEKNLKSNGDHDHYNNGNGVEDDGNGNDNGLSKRIDFDLQQSALASSDDEIGEQQEQGLYHESMTMNMSMSMSMNMNTPNMNSALFENQQTQMNIVDQDMGIDNDNAADDDGVEYVDTTYTGTGTGTGTGIAIHNEFNQNSEIRCSGNVSKSIIHPMQQQVNHEYFMNANAEKATDEVAGIAGIDNINVYAKPSLTNGNEPTSFTSTSTSTSIPMSTTTSTQYRLHEMNQTQIDHHMEEATGMIRQIHEYLNELQQIKVQNAILMDSMVMAGADFLE